MVREFLFGRSPKRNGVGKGKGVVRFFRVANPLGTRCLGWQRYSQSHHFAILSRRQLVFPRCQPSQHAVFGLATLFLGPSFGHSLTASIGVPALPTLSTRGVWVGNAILRASFGHYLLTASISVPAWQPFQRAVLGLATLISEPSCPHSSPWDPTSNVIRLKFPQQTANCYLLTANCNFSCSFAEQFEFLICLRDCIAILNSQFSFPRSNCYLLPAATC